MPPSNEPMQPNITPPTAPVPPTSTPQQPGPVAPPPAPVKSKMPLIIALVVIVLIAIGVAAYFLVINPTSPTTNSNQSNTNSQSDTTVTTMTTTNSPNKANGTVSFTHPTSWSVTKETNQYGIEATFIKSPLGNAVKMFTSDSVGGQCDPDTSTYTLVKKIPTKNASYFFTEYQATLEGWPQTLSLETYYDQKSTTHQALTEGQSNTGVCQNLFGYPIAKDIQVTLLNAAGKEAMYSDIKDDAEFLTMLESFSVTDN